MHQKHKMKIIIVNKCQNNRKIINLLVHVLVYLYPHLRKARNNKILFVVLSRKLIKGRRIAPLKQNFMYNRWRI